MEQALNSPNLALTALRGMLRPIARFCLRNGLHVQDMLEATKQVLVEVASEELKSGPKLSGPKAAGPNVSHLSVATGLQRREVLRFLEGEEAAAEPLGLPNRVIGQWVHDKRFRTKDGKPKTLPLDGSAHSFQSLVEATSLDIHPGTILRELERIQAVSRTANGLKLLTDSFVPRDDAATGYRILSRDLSSMIEAVTDNIRRQPKVPNLHATVTFDNIRGDKLVEIRSWLLAEGSKFQKRVSGYLSKFDADINTTGKPSPAGNRVTCSLFSLTPEEKVS